MLLGSAAVTVRTRRKNSGRTRVFLGVSNVTEKNPLGLFSHIRQLGKISIVPKEIQTKLQDGGKRTVALAKVINTLPSPVALATPSAVTQKAWYTLQGILPGGTI